MTAKRKKILLINADQNEAIRKRIDDSIAPLRFDDGPEIKVVTLVGGPHLMQTQEDIDQVGPPVKKMIEADTETDVFVVVCFADPGLAEARKAAGGRKVFGINQSGVNTAMALGEKFGVISISDAAVERHRKYYESLKIMDRFAGEVAANIELPQAAAESDDPTAALDPKVVAARLVECGKELIAKGADAIVLGEGGMSSARSAMEQALGVPIVDPTASAVGMAIVAATDFGSPK